MKGINTIIPESIDVKEAKKSASGKWYYSYGIKVDGDWYNGVLYEKTHADALAKHEGEIELYFYEEEYKGEMKKKCRTLTVMDRRFEGIEKRLDALEESLSGKNDKTEIEPTDLEKAQSDPQAAGEEGPLTDLPF